MSLRIRAGAMLATLLLTLGGCAAQSAFEHGNRLLDIGRYDAAVQRLALAARLDPANERYRQALARAQSLAAEWHIGEARRASADRDLAAAERHARQAVAYRPDGAEAIAALAQTVQAVADAEARRADALRQADAGQFEPAVAALRSALAAHRTLPGGREDLARLELRTADHLADRAADALDRDDWDAAEAQANKALEYLPGHAHAGGVLRTVADRRRADALVAQARLDIAQDRLEAALAALEQAAALHPARTDIPPLVAQAQGSLADQLLARARHAAADGDPATAARLLLRCRELAPNRQDVAALLAESRARLAAGHRAVADAALRDQRFGLALAHYLLADSYAPGAAPPGAIEHCRDRIVQRITFDVAVGADGRSSDHLTPQAFRTALVAALGEAAGPLVRVREADGRPAHLTVAVRLSALDVRTSQTEHTGTVRYREGTRLVANPDHDRAVRARDQAGAQVDRYADEVSRLAQSIARASDREPSAGRDRDLSSLRDSLRSTRRSLDSARSTLDSADRRVRDTPAQIEEPNYVEHTYPIYEVTRTARVSAAMAVVPLGAEQPPPAAAIDGSALDRDRLVHADPQHHVPGDPLVLESEETLLGRAFNRSIGRATQAALGWIEARADGMLAAADAADAAGRSDDAVEYELNFLFTRPAADPRTGEVLQSLIRRVRHEADLVSLPDALRARCGVPR